MSQQPESGTPVVKLYAIELPDGSIAMSGPYVLATESEGQAGRMAHARDGQEVAFVRELQQAQSERIMDATDMLDQRKHPAWEELQQAQGVGESGLDDLCQRLSEHGAKSGRRAATKAYNDGVPTHTEMLMGQAVDAIRRLATPQSSAPVVGEEPDLFWDDNDPEFARESIDEVVHRRWEDGNLVTGDTVTVQRAIRLSNVTVIATVPDEYPDGDTEITYTVVESALTEKANG